MTLRPTLLQIAIVTALLIRVRHLVPVTATVMACLTPAKPTAIKMDLRTSVRFVVAYCQTATTTAYLIPAISFRVWKMTATLIRYLIVAKVTVMMMERQMSVRLPLERSTATTTVFLTHAKLLAVQPTVIVTAFWIPAKWRLEISTMTAFLIVARVPSL